MTYNIVIDNGSYEVKVGATGQDSPNHIPNCCIRTSDKNVILGSQLEDLNDYSGINIRRPIEKNQLTQWYLEKQIWDNHFISKPDSSGDPNDYLFDNNLIYMESPASLNKFSTFSDQVIFEEYGVRNYYRCFGSSLIPWLDMNSTVKSKKDTAASDTTGEDLKTETEENSENLQVSDTHHAFKDFQLVIDSGFDSTWVVPMIYGLPFYEGIRRMPVAGRLLTSYLREMISFRHYNVTDETILVNNIKERACYVSTDYDLSLKKVEKLRQNPRLLFSIDKLKANNLNNTVVDYILPDYKKSKRGYVLDPNSNSTNFKKNNNNEESDDEFDDPSERQVLRLFDERFAIPELLFHPELAGLHKSGLVRTIQDCLSNVPELLRPLLLANIVVVGGTSNLPGFKERLIKDLRELSPLGHEVKIGNYSNSSTKGENDDFFTNKYGSKSQDYSWYGGVAMFEKDGFNKVSISKQEYFENGVDYCRQKFQYKYKSNI